MAIFPHMVGSALGERSASAKNLSSRRRRTFGKQDAFAASIADDPEASGGTRSAASDASAIVAPAANINGTSPIPANLDSVTTRIAIVERTMHTIYEGWNRVVGHFESLV